VHDQRRNHQNLARRPPTPHHQSHIRQNLAHVRKHLKGLGQNQYLKLQAKQRKINEELYQDSINAYPKRETRYHQGGFYQAGDGRMEGYVK